MLYKLLKKYNKKREYPQNLLKDKNITEAKAKVTRKEIRNQTPQLLFGVSFFFPTNHTYIRFPHIRELH